MRSSLNRARIEAFLSVEMAAVTEWAERRGIPLDVWPSHPAARGWLDLAIGRAVERALALGRARSRSAALRIVCGAFGLDGDNERRRWERDRKNWRQKCRSISRPRPVHCDA